MGDIFNGDKSAQCYALHCAIEFQLGAAATLYNTSSHSVSESLVNGAWGLPGGNANNSLFNGASLDLRTHRVALDNFDVSKYDYDMSMMQCMGGRNCCEFVKPLQQCMRNKCRGHENPVMSLPSGFEMHLEKLCGVHFGRGRNMVPGPPGGDPDTGASIEVFPLRPNPDGSLNPKTEEFLPEDTEYWFEGAFQFETNAIDLEPSYSWF